MTQIRRAYGEKGLDHYVEGSGSEGRITDDTQMTIFTAEGLMRAYQKGLLTGKSEQPTVRIYHSYLRWLHTQRGGTEILKKGTDGFDLNSGWLISQRELFSHRAPGSTCLSALRSEKCGTVSQPINDSKGCGGIMRVAPVGLFHHDDFELAFDTACDAAAITHGHPSGYLSAGCLASILACLVQGQDLEKAIANTMLILRKRKSHAECLNAIENALSLYQNEAATGENIETLGGGWVGEEALSISLFCALHFQADFRGGVVAAINHSGDCDSTGAVTGNILGALLGKSAIPVEWIKNLIEAHLVEQIAADLFVIDRHSGTQSDLDWSERYPG